MKRYLVLTLILVMAVSFAATQNSLQRLVASGVLRVGMDAAGYMPFEGINSNGDWIGFDVDFAKLMAEELGVKLEIVPTRWSGILASLVSNKFDFIISAMTITPKRAIMVNFSIPYFTVGQEILYNKDVFSTPPTISELLARKDLKVAVQIGTTGDDAAKSFFKNAKVLEFASMDEAAMQVALKKADIAVADSTYVDYAINKYSQLASIDQRLTNENYGVAMRQGEPDLLNWVNTFITYIKANGTWQKLYDKWFVNYHINQ
jgi:polar amino acid transport system substrate-binding protein